MSEVEKEQLEHRTVDGRRVVVLAPLLLTYSLTTYLLTYLLTYLQAVVQTFRDANLTHPAGLSVYGGNAVSYTVYVSQ